MLCRGRLGRRVPGREPRADVDAAAPEAALLLRPRHRGGDRAPRPDPGRHGASLPAPARRAASRSTIPPRRCEAVLGKTLGVPLFQEQAMQIAIVAAGFTPDEADKLRRAMATFRHIGTIHTFREKFIAGMVGNGYAARVRRALLQPDRGLRRVRLPREPRGQLRAPGLRLVLDQAALPRRLLRRHPQQPADGLLPAGPARARRPRARRRGAPPRHQR